MCLQTGQYLKPKPLQGVRLKHGEYVDITASILPNNILSLPSEVLGLDLHLYPDKGSRLYDPIRCKAGYVPTLGKYLNELEKDELTKIF